MGTDGSYAALYRSVWRGRDDRRLRGDDHVVRADPRDAEKSINKLPSKYSDQSTPLLKATVKEGKNEIPPFQLKP